MTEPAKDIPTLPSQIEDDEKRFETVKKLLAAQASMVEVRGYELARLNPRGEWEQEERYQPTERGLNQAAANARWLNERHPGTLYQARVLVSAQIPDRPKPPSPEYVSAVDPKPAVSARAQLEYEICNNPECPALEHPEDLHSHPKSTPNTSQPEMNA